jgi:hypothetical protein
MASSVAPPPVDGEEGEHHRHGSDAELDESLDESFPSSDPPSTWAGADSDA